MIIERYGNFNVNFDKFGTKIRFVGSNELTIDCNEFSSAYENVTLMVYLKSGKFYMDDMLSNIGKSRAAIIHIPKKEDFYDLIDMDNVKITLCPVRCFSFKKINS